MTLSGKELAALLDVTPQALSKAVREEHYCADHDVSQWAVYSESGFVKGFDVPQELLGRSISGDGHHQPQPVLQPFEAPPEPRPNPLPSMEVDQPRIPEINVNVEPAAVNVSVEIESPDSALYLLAGFAALGLAGWLIYLINRQQAEARSQAIRPGSAATFLPAPGFTPLNSPFYPPIRAATVRYPTAWS